MEKIKPTKRRNPKDAEWEKHVYEAWALLRKNNPFKGMTRQQILKFVKS